MTNKPFQRVVAAVLVAAAMLQMVSVAFTGRSKKR